MKMPIKWRFGHKQWFNLVLFVICYSVLPGAAQDDEYVRSPSHLKRDVLNSFVFQGRDIFYSNGASASSDLTSQPLSP